jgi:hypothetical protein
MKVRAMKPRIADAAYCEGFCVWSEDMNEPERGRYIGPKADVYIRDGWLFVQTDRYEGSAMMNAETLPALRKALAKLARRLKENAG